MTFRVINRFGDKFENRDDLFMCYLIQLADSFYRALKFETVLLYGCHAWTLRKILKKET